MTQFMAIMTRFLDKVIVPWVIRYESWHDFDSCRVLFKCFSLFLKESFEEREKLGITKEVTLWLSVFVVRFS